VTWQQRNNPAQSIKGEIVHRAPGLKFCADESSQNENSPELQLWVGDVKQSSPGGTEEMLAVRKNLSSLAGLLDLSAMIPALKRWAIIKIFLTENLMMDTATAPPQRRARWIPASVMLKE
jgi:hypothetical protein